MSYLPATISKKMALTSPALRGQNFRYFHSDAARKWPVPGHAAKTVAASPPSAPERVMATANVAGGPQR